jgi:hypothetical protein
MPAAMRNPMSVDKPAQTPASPKTDGAYNKTSAHTMPATICIQNSINIRAKEKKDTKN